VAPVPRYLSQDHVHAAACKAISDEWTNYTGPAGLLSADPFRPDASLPAAPTTFGGPDSAFPTDGDIYHAEPTEDRHSWDVPWVSCYIAGEFETGDGMSSGEVHVDVEVEVRCRFGLDSSNNAGRLAHPMSAAHAKWCAHAAQVIIQDKIGETARTLDATNAYGIIGPIGASDIAVDERPPDEGRPASVVQFDAIASVTIRQTQYRGWVTA